MMHGAVGSLQSIHPYQQPIVIMKKQTSIILAALVATTLHAAAQGSLTPPPGAPAPVMKSLDQIEARIPLVAGSPGVSIDENGTITISQPGSYYLTGNLTITTVNAPGISIENAASPLTIDLNGYSLICTSVLGGNAINSLGTARVSIRNGQIQGGTTVSGSTFTLNGWNDGVFVPGHATVENLQVSGVRRFGIDARWSTSRVLSCSVDIAGGYGIIAPHVTDSTARRCQNDGIWVGTTSPGSYLISNCIAESIGTTIGEKFGIDANLASTGTPGAVVMNSVGSAISGYGIRASMVTNCSGKGSLFGIRADNVTNSYGSSTSSGTGINCRTASFCRGYSLSGLAISANIAIGCTSERGSISSAQKHLGTP